MAPQWVQKIPCCGACFKPTQNPYQGCVRQTSNENTAPFNSSYMKLAPYIEFPWFCRKCGTVGLQWSTRRRVAFMFAAVLISVVGVFCAAFGILGISESPAVLRSFSWVYVDIQMPSGSMVRSSIGLKGRLDSVDCSSSASPSTCGQTVLNLAGFQETDPSMYERYIAWDHSDSCTLTDESGDRLFSQEVCDNCRDSALATASFAITSMILSLPVLKQGLQRSTKFGDLNCQACYSRTAAFIAFASGVSSLASFSEGCYFQMPTTSLNASFEWSLGTYLVMIVAVILKAIHGILHLLVATPSGKHTVPAEGTTFVEYLMLGVDDPGQGAAQDVEHDSADVVPAEVVGNTILSGEGHGMDLDKDSCRVDTTMVDV